jgi:DNA-binding transcriptional ArsR family regulator
MTWRNLFVYFWLLSETSNDEDDLRRPRAAAEIARVLHLSAPTVRVVLEELLAEEIIELDKDGRVARCFLPHEDWIDATFLDKPTKPTKLSVEQVEEMTEGEKVAYVEGGTESGRVYRHLRAYGGFTGHQIKYISDTSDRLWHEMERFLEDKVLIELLRLAKTDHAKNQKTGKYQNEPTCWKLFKHMFDKLCQSKGLSISA